MAREAYISSDIAERARQAGYRWWYNLNFIVARTAPYVPAPSCHLAETARRCLLPATAGGDSCPVDAAARRFIMVTPDRCARIVKARKIAAWAGNAVQRD